MSNEREKAAGATAVGWMHRYGRFSRREGSLFVKPLPPGRESMEREKISRGAISSGGNNTPEPRRYAQESKPRSLPLANRHGPDPRATVQEAKESGEHVSMFGRFW